MYGFIINECHSRDDKLQHDMLACHEGIALLDDSEDAYCIYETVYPYNEGLKGIMTHWGSKTTPTKYRDILAVISFKNNIHLDS